MCDVFLVFSRTSNWIAFLYQATHVTISLKFSNLEFSDPILTMQIYSFENHVLLFFSAGDAFFKRVASINVVVQPNEGWVVTDYTFDFVIGFL